jgi:RimJ/RimL family protein N-acetyltransferase
MESTDVVLSTPRLDLAPWRSDDAQAALTIYGNPEVAHWLTPAVEPIKDQAAMREAIEGWLEVDREEMPPAGHWAVRRRADSVVVGSVTLRKLPPGDEDLELAWQFAPEHWGNGYATESAYAVARWGFEQSAHELFAVSRPGNERATRLAQRLGMSWVGETDKYYDLQLQVFRVRPPELIAPQIDASATIPAPRAAG